MVAVFMPGLKSTSRAKLPDHQSQAAFPGLIQEVSAIADGGFRLITMLDSIRRPGSAPIMTTRQGVRRGVTPVAASSGSSARGASRASITRPDRAAAWARYIPG